jgi:predicted DNA-binding transcriptional regulator YafY
MYEETKRISRVLELTSMIARNPRRYLRRDLAQKFGVSERMIQKDLELIRHGLKLSLSHSLEGYCFDNLPHLPTLNYSFAEALALWLAVQVSRQISGICSSELASAISRLESIFPADFSLLLRELSIQPCRTTTQQDHRQRTLGVLGIALMEGRKVSIVYETRSRGGEINERVVRPYHLMAYVRSWQLIAHCERRDAVLMFKIDRIREATLLDERYCLPADFDLEDYLGMAWGIMRGEQGEPENVVLRFEPDAGHWVMEEQWHKSQRTEELQDGSILFRLRVIITPEFINWLLYYGSRVEVLEPTGLRSKVAAEHSRAARLYSPQSNEADRR